MYIHIYIYICVHIYIYITIIIHVPIFVIITILRLITIFVIIVRNILINRIIAITIQMFIIALVIIFICWFLRKYNSTYEYTCKHNSNNNYNYARISTYTGINHQLKTINNLSNSIRKWLNRRCKTMRCDAIDPRSWPAVCPGQPQAPVN